MAMTIQHDGSSAMILGETAKNTNALSKNLKKLASGQKINGAGDDASGYAISEKMRVRLRALEQDTRNSQTGASLLKVAEGGVQNILEELRALKELALNAANDTNTDLDRATIQKDFDQRRANIDHIAEETNYNGKSLLNGTFRCTIEGVPYRELIGTSTTTDTVTTGPTQTTDTEVTTTRSEPTVTTTTTSNTVRQDTMPTTGTTVTGPNVTTVDGASSTTTTGPDTTTGSDSDTATSRISADGQMTETITTTNTTAEVTESAAIVTEPSTETAVTTTTTVSAVPVEVEVETKNLANGTTTITESGVYKLASNFTGTLTISAANVTLVGAGTTLNNVFIVDNGVEDLYIKDLKISNTQDKSAIAFDSSSSNKLHLLGTNTIISAVSSQLTKAVIYAGGGLSVVGNGSLSLTANKGGFSELTQGAILGSNSGSSGACGDIAIGQGVTLDISGDRMFTGIGAGGGDCGNISIGTGAHVSIKSTSGSTCTGIGSRLSGSTCGDITIYSGATVDVDGSGCPAIGSGVGNVETTDSVTHEPIPNYSACGNVTIYSGATVTATQKSSNAERVSIGTSERISQCGDVTIYSYDSGNVTLNKGVGKGGPDIIYYGSFPLTSTVIGAVTLTNAYNATELVLSDDTNPFVTTKYDVTTAVTTETAITDITKTTTTTTRDTTTTTVTTVTTNLYSETPAEDETGTPLVIHHGTKANVALNVHLEDMRTRALKGDIPSPEDQERLAKLSGDEAAALQAVLDEATDKTLDDAKVTTQHNATVAITVIEGAIQYALDQSTTIGAYLSRLGFTEANLITATENTQQSESTIRDADMAREMAEYTKNNVLLQASQSMLAQANQNSSSVLSLLQ